MSVYSEEILERAQHDYRGICQIEYTIDGNSFVCTLQNSITDLNLTANEFFNYLVEVAILGDCQ